MKQEFYSNGKLFITGEYLVLDGGTAFSLPTKFGQSLTVEHQHEKIISWKSFDSDGSIWFEEKISVETILSKSKQNNKVAETLVAILFEANKMNPEILANSHGFLVETRLTFPRNWGLGTSSTLINNIASWFKIDAFELLQKSFGGSGYDIANAQHNSPICYNLVEGKPIVKPVEFHPDFTSKLYFIYLNQKKDSKEAIAAYRQKKEQIQEAIEISHRIASEIIQTKNVNDFGDLLQQYENLLSPILEIETIQTQLFPDFNGVVKSLGAWGGDFVMAVSDENPTAYFQNKGYSTILPYHEMIL